MPKEIDAFDLVVGDGDENPLTYQRLFRFLCHLHRELGPPR
jgi:hypothetical protein